MTSTTISAILFFLAFAVSHFTLTSTSNAIGKSKGLITKLIHHDSMISPFYNPNQTIFDRGKRVMETSSARLAQVSASYSEKYDIRTNLFPSNSTHLFYVNFSIGYPPVPQIAIMDTGGSLVWVKCLPCTTCLDKSAPIFYPNKSTTYGSVKCRRDTCPYSFCKSGNECTFNMKYIEGAGVLGIYILEQLTFDTLDDGKIAQPELTLGCGHQMESDTNYNGIFGLGFDRHDIYPFISQLDSKFSYCVGNVMDTHYKYHHLHIGEEAIMQGDSTPLLIDERHYNVILEGISIEGEMLEIDPKIFEKTPGVNNGVIIDSGTLYTWLVKDAFDILSEEVQSILQGVLTPNYDWEGQLCYNGIVSEDLLGFPVVGFHFADGADLVLDTQSMFFQVDSRVFCMAVSSTSHLSGPYGTNMSAIGMMAQQNYNVGYDIEGKKLYFQRIDCQLLED